MTINDLTAREAALFLLFANEQANSPFMDAVKAASSEDDQAFGGLCSNLVQKGLLTIDADDDRDGCGYGDSLFYFTGAGFDLAEAQGIWVDRN